MKKHITKRPKGFALALGAPGLLFVIIPVIFAIFVPSMMGYVKKSKTSSVNATASTVMKAANSALTELDEENHSITEDCIISSDKSKNLNISSSDADLFYEKASYYYDDMSDMDYFIIVEDGCCSDVAVIDDSGYVGTYGSLFGYNSGKKFNELYEEALEYIY